MFSSCENYEKTIINTKTTEPSKTFVKSNLKKKIPIVLDSETYLAENYLDFEKSNEKPVSSDIIEMADQRHYNYNRTIFGIKSKVGYTFGGDILQEVIFTIPVKDNDKKQELLAKIKLQATKIYNLSENDFKEESEKEYSFRKSVFEDAGVVGSIKINKNGLKVTIYTMHASGFYY